MHKLNVALKFTLLAFVFCQCNRSADNNTRPVAAGKTEKKRMAPKNIVYHMQNSADWLAKNGTDSVQHIISTVNRTDMKHLGKLDSLLEPDDMTAAIDNYLPFPYSVAAIKDIPKIIFFSYPTQSFGAYEMGELVYTGAVNMGRKKDPTPTGLYYTNWKAEKTTSTFNDEWDLLWNVNIENKLGIGWHQYDLPGYPVSHSCLRLLEKDARYLYDWADQWIVDDNDSVMAQGTPVIVFGNYPFGTPKPWLQLVTNSHALDISPETIQQQVEPFLTDILAQQKRREGASLPKSSL